MSRQPPSWSPPCRALLPKLLKLYEEVNSEGERLLLVYVPCEEDDETFRSTFKDMCWHAMDFTRTDQRKRLMEVLGVDAVPSLVLAKKGKRGLQCKNRHALECLLNDPAARNFPWVGGSKGGDR